VTTPFDLYNGRLTGLIDVLLADPGWAPVFASLPAIVFAENTPANADAIRRNVLPRDRLYKLLLQSCEDWIASQPGIPPPHVARGDLLLRLGDRAAALRSYEEALRIAPNHPVARAKADWLRTTGVK
jgi:tetratricopeptide (TPR) repeat protein